MAGEVIYQTARGLLLYGRQLREGNLTRKRFFEEIDPKDGAFRVASDEIGSVAKTPGLRFFDSKRQSLAFGPGAGLVLGVSLGSQSLRVALVDANGELHHKYEGERMPDQLELEPEELLDRMRAGAAEVLGKALEDKALLVNGALPFLGVSTAWPAPVTRDKHTVGYALRHDLWRHGQRLDEMVAAHLSLDLRLSNAINDAAAAAIGVAHLQTNEPQHLDQTFPRLAMVLRLAGGIGGSTIVVEAPTEEPGRGISSGFPTSILTGGVDHLSGEIGHVPVELQLVAELNKTKTRGLGALKPLPCSCTTDEDRSRSHLEAFASAGALAQRIDRKAPLAEVAARILDEPEKPAHKKALQDVGALIAASLAGPVAVFNPATLVLTGAMAVPEVEKSVRSGLSKVRVFGSLPEVSVLDDEENKFIGVKGAGMVVLRRKIFRRFPEILGVPKKSLKASVRNATVPLTELPW